MIEPEVAFADSNDNMDLQEEFICHIVARALERCGPELEILERDVGMLESVTPPFPRISYSEAVERLNAERRAAGPDSPSPFEWGRDLGAVEEMTIASWFDRPVFVYNYPREAKAFYMKENPDDPRTVLCNDLLAPEGYGEIIGGSQREDDAGRLIERIREEELPEEAYGWYLDLRRYGTFPHSGFASASNGRSDGSRVGPTSANWCPSRG